MLESRAVKWPISEFALVKSINHSGGTRYEVMRRWGLRERGSSLVGDVGLG